eukprot:8666402-Lingulodinium_polyedra.AAC.1
MLPTPKKTGLPMWPETQTDRSSCARPFPVRSRLSEKRWFYVGACQHPGSTAMAEPVWAYRESISKLYL